VRRWSRDQLLPLLAWNPCCLEKEGFISAPVLLKRRVSAATFGNLAFSAMALNPVNGPGGLSDNPWSRSQQVAFALILPAIGAGVDVITGAAYAAPARVHVKLKATAGQGVCHTRSHSALNR